MDLDDLSTYLSQSSTPQPVLNVSSNQSLAEDEPLDEHLNGLSDIDEDMEENGGGESDGSDEGNSEKPQNESEEFNFDDFINKSTQMKQKLTQLQKSSKKITKKPTKAQLKKKAAAEAKRVLAEQKKEAAKAAAEAKKAAMEAKKAAAAAAAQKKRGGNAATPLTTHAMQPSGKVLFPHTPASAPSPSTSSSTTSTPDRAKLITATQNFVQQLVSPQAVQSSTPKASSSTLSKVVISSPVTPFQQKGAMTQNTPVNPQSMMSPKLNMIQQKLVFKQTSAKKGEAKTTPPSQVVAIQSPKTPQNSNNLRVLLKKVDFQTPVAKIIEKTPKSQKVQTPRTRSSPRLQHQVQSAQKQQNLNSIQEEQHVDHDYIEEISFDEETLKPSSAEEQLEDDNEYVKNLKKLVCTLTAICHLAASRPKEISPQKRLAEEVLQNGSKQRKIDEPQTPLGEMEVDEPKKDANAETIQVSPMIKYKELREKLLPQRPSKMEASGPSDKSNGPVNVSPKSAVPIFFNCMNCSGTSRSATKCTRCLHTFAAQPKQVAVVLPVEIPPKALEILPATPKVTNSQVGKVQEQKEAQTEEVTSSDEIEVVSEIPPSITSPVVNLTCDDSSSREFVNRHGVRVSLPENEVAPNVAENPSNEVVENSSEVQEDNNSGEGSDDDVDDEGNENEPPEEVPAEFINRQGKRVTRDGVVLGDATQNRRVLGDVIVFDPNDVTPSTSATPKPTPVTQKFSVDAILNPTESNNNFEITLNLIWNNEKTEKHLMRINTPFSQLFALLASREKCDVSNVVLMLNDKVILPDDTPQSIHYHVSKIITGRIVRNLSVSRSTRRQKKQNLIKIKIQAAGVKKPFILQIDKTKTFEEVFDQCAQHFSANLDKLKLKIDGDFIDRNSTPQELDFTGDEVIDCIIAK